MGQLLKMPPSIFAEPCADKDNLPNPRLVGLSILVSVLKLWYHLVQLEIK